MTPNDTYSQLSQKLREISVLGSCAAVLGWDEQTYMPPNGGAFRGEQMGLLAKLCHEQFTAPEIGDSLSTLEGSDLVSDPDSVISANVRELRRSYSRATKIPSRLVSEMARVTTLAQGEWRNARQKNDFSLFQPWLEQVLNLKREEADIVGYTEHRYDALLDEYEPGMTAARLKVMFADLAKNLVPIIQAIQNSKQKPNSEILHRNYPIELQKAFAESAAKQIGYDFESGRLDVTAHPFCTGIGPGDCRITTRYNANFFNESFFGVLHEAGHGLYEQGLPADSFGLPTGSACSLGVHESQSRFWENQVGRSRIYWEMLFPKAQLHFSNSLGETNRDDFYFAINEVKPSFIRVEADEATYNLHIILRFELELALLAGELEVKDLPQVWKDRFTQLFGITPPDDKLGCLQDVHWSMGGLGYFPTYTLGNLYSAQLMNAAQTQLGNLNELILKGDFVPLREWLREKIHIHGKRYTAERLIQNAVGEAPNSTAFVEYLKGKYQPLYQF